jgi:hypothetical protein
VVGLRVDHQQHAAEGVRTGDQEALLRVVVRVRHRAGQIVVEDFNGIREVDTVLAPIRLALGLVPLEVDIHAPECMHKRPT